MPSRPSAVVPRAVIARLSRESCPSNPGSASPSRRLTPPNAPVETAANRLAQRDRGFDYFIVIHDLVDETPIECSLGIDHSIGQEQLHGSFVADRTGQQKSASGIRCKTHRRVGGRKLRAPPRNCEIRGKHQPEARACRRPLHTDDDRGIHAREVRRAVVQNGRELSFDATSAPDAIIPQIAAEARFFPSRQDDGAQRGITADRLSSRQELAAELQIHGVRGLRAHQGEMSEGVADLEAYCRR